MENANDHPFKVSIVKDAKFFANSHPYKVTIEGGGGNEGKVVDELPEEGETGYIYLVLKEESSEGNIYDEYMWVLKQDETYGWEHIGATNEVTVTTMKTLTSEDCNYPASNPTSVAMWLLESGVYKAEDGLDIKEASNFSTTASNANCWIVTQPTASKRGQIIRFSGASSIALDGIDVDGNNFTLSPLVTTITQSTGSSATATMSQNAITNAINDSVGGVRILTADDYNWNSVNKSTSGTLDSFALWLLDDGLYSFADGIVTQKIKTDKNNSIPGSYATNNHQAPTILIISGTDTWSRRIKTFIGTETNGSNGENAFFVIGTDTDGNSRWGSGGSVEQYGLTRRDVVDDLNGGGNSGNTIPLSAYQGKVLNDKIGQIETVLQTLTTGNGV